MAESLMRKDCRQRVALLLFTGPIGHRQDCPCQSIGLLLRHPVRLDKLSERQVCRS